MSGSKESTLYSAVVNTDTTYTCVFTINSQEYTVNPVADVVGRYPLGFVSGSDNTWQYPRIPTTLRNGSHPKP